MKKIIWFSRHELTEAQISDLRKVLKSEIEVEHINRTVNSAFELKAEVEACDAAAVVMPLNLQQQMLKLLDGKPMLVGRNHRVQQPDGSFRFHHAGWDRIDKIEIVKKTLSEFPAPENEFRKA